MSRYLNTPNPAPDQDPLDAPMTVTLFPDQYAKTKAEKTLSLRRLAAGIEKRIAPSKDLLPFLKGATFGDVPSDKNCLRYDSNVLSITGVEVDYDAGDVAPVEAVGLVEKAGITALIYTTPSDGKPGKGRRWRVFCPLSKAHSPEQRTALLARLNGALGGMPKKSASVIRSAWLDGH